jgi:hypothetical protein
MKSLSAALFGLAGLIALQVVTPTRPAQATVINAGSLTLDTDTGLEWLDLTFSFGLTVTQVVNDLQPGGIFAGFRYANEDEFDTLASHFFSPPYNPNILDATETVDFMALLGGGPPFLSGLIAPLLGPLGPNGDFQACQETVEIVGPPPGTHGVISGQCFSGGGSPAVGSFLVRAVAEPSSLVLLATVFGFFLLAMRLSCRRHA